MTPVNASATSTRVAPRSPTADYALVRAQGRTIAIPSAVVIQAVECPAELAQVPRVDGGVEGVMTIGTRVVPVISLLRWMKPASNAQESPEGIKRSDGLVLLLRQGQVHVGIAIEDVIGTHRIRSDQVKRLFHDDNPKELVQSVAIFGNDTAPTSILEPDRLMALAGVWLADDAAASVKAIESAAIVDRPSRAESHATFRIADVLFALPATNVGELIRRPVMRSGLLPRDGVLGICDWRGRVVPVVDLAGVLHALPSGEEASWLCIVCKADLAIGIVMYEVLEINKLASDAGTPEHAAATERSVVARRLVMGDRLLQVIDVDALMRRYSETALSKKGFTAAETRGSPASVAPAYMVFTAGGPFAASIDGVQEVVVLPDELRPRLEAGIATTLHWREQPVPIMAIADDLVRMPVKAARQLIVVRQGNRLAALAIDGVKGLVPRGVAASNRMRLGGRPVDIISVDIEDHRASYPVVDLQAAFITAS
ncbi:MAG: chemotaxis protein CheW [Rhizobacter sp.]|nr:chemotaxis protein CheW [Rhizobacter sp.]